MRELIEELIELVRLENLRRNTPNFIGYETKFENCVSELVRLAEKVDDQLVELRCRTNKY